jgi:hypothetical protein
MFDSVRKAGSFAIFHLPFAICHLPFFNLWARSRASPMTNDKYGKYQNGKWKMSS